MYSDPPTWKLRMDAYAHYGVDAFVYYDVTLPSATKQAIVFRSEEEFVVRAFTEIEGKRNWSQDAVVIPRDGPSAQVRARDIGLPAEHGDFEVVRPVYGKRGREAFEEARAYVGERGVVAPVLSIPALRVREEDMIEYCENPEAVEARLNKRGEDALARFQEVLSWRPDILVIGNSGMMVSNPPHIFRHLSLKCLQKVTEMAARHGVVSHVHCCGPERALVEIAANETQLDAIEPLEVPPMGDCVLREIKSNFGKRLALKGNLHTTEVMLLGTKDSVAEACRQAIDDAAEGGGFILSTGDQTPRDTPDENILTMLEVAETYGRY